MAGTPLDDVNTGGGVHTGMESGTNSVMWQRGDGINIAVLFNTDETVVGAPDHLAYLLGVDINAIIDNGGFSWPTFAVDGFWVEFGSGSTLQVGGYNAPFHSLSTALANTTDGTKLRFQPGSTSWTGTINEKMRLDSPFGLVRIGQ
jgi:hypothetical protein